MGETYEYGVVSIVLLISGLYLSKLFFCNKIQGWLPGKLHNRALNRANNFPWVSHLKCCLQVHCTVSTKSYLCSSVLCTVCRHTSTWNYKYSMYHFIFYQFHNIFFCSCLYITFTANEGLVRIQYEWLVPIHVFPEIKLLFPKQNYTVLSPSSNTHISVRDLYIYRISLPILLHGKYVEWSWESQINKWDFTCSIITCETNLYRLLQPLWPQTHSQPWGYPCSSQGWINVKMLKTIAEK